MHNKFFLALIVVLPLTLYWALAPETTTPESPQITPQEKTKGVTSNSGDQVDTPQTEQLNPFSTETEPVSNKEEVGLNLEESMQETFSNIAVEYEQTMQFPTFSSPVLDPLNVQSPKPYEAASVVTKIPDIDGTPLPIEVNLALDKPYYERGEIIRVKTKLIGMQANQQATITAKILENREVLMSQTMTASGASQGFNEWFAEFSSEVLPESNMTKELTAAVETFVDGKPYLAAVMFNFGDTPALIKGVVNAKPVKEYLEIPLELSVKVAGYYFLRAVLDEKETSTPLIQLFAEGRLGEDNNTVTFRAHQAALKHVGSEGPYTLRILSAFRRPEPKERAPDAPMALPQDQFDVPGFSFDLYEDIGYSDPQVEQSLEFIRSLTTP